MTLRTSILEEDDKTKMFRQEQVKYWFVLQLRLIIIISLGYLVSLVKSMTYHTLCHNGRIH